MKGHNWVSMGVGAILGAALTLAGWVHADRQDTPSPATLVALAQEVEVSHRQVDLWLARGDVASAVAALEHLCAGPWPSPDAAGLVVELRHDAYGRLLRLRLDHPEVDPQAPETLLQTVQKGLEVVAASPNPFTARLHALQGEIYELLQRDDAALEAYERALVINRALLDREIGPATSRFRDSDGHPAGETSRQP